MNISTALEQSYKQLAPFSEKYTIDKRRLLFTLRTLERFNALKNKRVLDVGCGIGIMVNAYRLCGAHACGIDKFLFDTNDPLFHPGDVGALQRLWREYGIDVREADVFTDITLKERYDTVVSEAMIEHLRDPKAYLKRLFECVTPGGYVFISTPNLSNMLRRLRFLAGRSPLWDVKEFFDRGEHFTGHWREYTQKELREMCLWSGFEIIGEWNHNMLAPFKWSLKKMPRFCARVLSCVFPGSGDMNFILCKRP